MYLIPTAYAFGFGSEPISGTGIFALTFLVAGPILILILLILGLVGLVVRKKRSSQEQKAHKVRKVSLARITIGTTIGLIVLYGVLLILTEAI